MKRAKIILKLVVGGVLASVFVIAVILALLAVWPSNYPKSDEQLRQSVQREYQLPQNDHR